MKNFFQNIYLTFLALVVFSILVLATAFIFDVPIIDRITEIIETYTND